VFEAETPLDDVPSTQFNFELAKSLTEGVERIFIAGEALSHCVRASVEQLQSYISLAKTGPELVLLSDCASSVTGFESSGLEFIESFRAAGGKVMTMAQAIETLGC
jgi:nicotinamidase-related amidase